MTNRSPQSAEGEASFGQIDCAKLECVKNLFGRRYQTAQRFRNHTNIYTGLSCKHSLASRSFYFRTEQSNDIFKVEYLSHVEYALKDFTVCQIKTHSQYHRLPRPGKAISRGPTFD